MKLEGAKVAVVGMARSGVAAVKLLREKGATVRAVDQKSVVMEGIEVEQQSEAAFADAHLIVLSPGVPADLPELRSSRARGVKIVGDLELASWFLEGEIIGITGANGKTTTTALTGHILKASGIAAQVGGNIGTPPASMVDTSRAGQLNVLELSSFQLETTERFHAHIGAD
jgi:UDP-N-acetylmuramoylalanine--D-glutamate ligase